MSFKFNPFSGNFDQIDPNTKGLVQADYFDPVSTILPTGTSATIDGQSIVNGDRVLFSNLSLGNNQIYTVSGVGTSLAWTLVSEFDQYSTPIAGNLVSIKSGNGFASQIARFDGTNWKVNENIRLFDGANYQEISSIKKSTLANNSTTDVIDVTFAGSENMEISYSVIRGSRKESGKLYLSGFASDAQVSRNVVALSGDVGIDFEASRVSTNIKLQAITDSSGGVATLTYFVTRWSDSTGGPAGVPNYASASTSTPAAGSSTGDIQLRGSDGNLAADANFNWNESTQDLNISGLEMGGLKSAPLNNNQTTNSTLISFDAANYHHAIIEYSINRNTNFRTGRLIIVSDGTTAGFSGDHVETSDPGITFNVTVSSGNVLLQYTSTNTGSSGTFKYSIKKWN